MTKIKKIPTNNTMCGLVGGYFTVIYLLSNLNGLFI